MRPEQVIAAIRFDPLLPVWADRPAGRAVAGRRRRAGAVAARPRHAAPPRRVRRPAAVAHRPAPGAGDPRNRCATSACWSWISPPPCRLATGRTLPTSRGSRSRRRPRSCATWNCGTVTVPESGNAGTQLFAEIDRALADIPRVPLRRHRRHYRRAGARPAEGRARRRAAEPAADRQGRRKPTAACG